MSAAAAARQEFLDWLAHERRASPLTVAAYGRDIAAFLGFLTGHLGGEPDLRRLPGCGWRISGPGWRSEAGEGRGRGDAGAASVGGAEFLSLAGAAARRGERAASPAGNPEGAPAAAAGAVAGARPRGGGGYRRGDQQRRHAGARCRAVYPAVWLRPAHFRGAFARCARRRRCRAGMPRCGWSARDGRNGWCRCCRWCARRSRPGCATIPVPAPDAPLFTGARGARLNPAVAQRRTNSAEHVEAARIRREGGQHDEPLSRSRRRRRGLRRLSAGSTSASTTPARSRSRRR